jgi:hypothetical protein
MLETNDCGWKLVSIFKNVYHIIGLKLSPNDGFSRNSIPDTAKFFSVAYVVVSEPKHATHIYLIRRSRSRGVLSSRPLHDFTPYVLKLIFIFVFKRCTLIFKFNSKLKLMVTSPPRTFLFQKK